MVLIWQELCHPPQQKSYKFCSWEISVFKQNWKINLFFRIKSGPGLRKDCSLKDWNRQIYYENSPRAIHSDFRSSFVSYSNAAVFKLNPISPYRFKHSWKFLVQQEVYKVARVTSKVVAVLTWCQLCTIATKGEGCSCRPRPQVQLWCQHSQQKQISQAFSSHVSYWSCTFLLLTEAKYQGWSTKNRFST